MKFHFFVEKLKGGSEKVEILVACNLDNLQQKIRNRVFLSAALHGKKWVQSLKN